MANESFTPERTGEIRNARGVAHPDLSKESLEAAEQAAKPKPKMTLKEKPAK